MTAYYNEIDPFAAQWLRNLIAAGQIAAGDVDERSIVDVQPDDLRGYTQCHFFAGIGGWSVALRLAMWGDDRPVWTGSCPCQPFSTAGKQKGHGDGRHLWPYWSRLVRECRPSVIFGEQVAAAVAYGWWDDVAADLETQGYACAAAVLPACSVGKPHKRDRLWFVGDAEHHGHPAASQPRSEGAKVQRGEEGEKFARQFEGASFAVNVSDTAGAGLEGAAGESLQGDGGRLAGDSGVVWVEFPDGKQRPVEPRICLLAHGVQNRAPKLRGYGNAIVPQVGAEFITAYMEARP